VCVCAFSLRRESPDMILGDKPLIFEVVLSQTQSKGLSSPNSKNDKSPARDDVFSIWSDAPPYLSIGQSSWSAPKWWMLPDAYGLYWPTSHIKLTCKYLGFQTIRFKFHGGIRQRPISFQNVILRTAQDDKRLCASRRSVKLCPTSNKRSRST
jgi:hypothetical protein